MLSYTKLAANARRFKTLTGISPQEFDLLFARVEKAYTADTKFEIGSLRDC